MSCTAALLGTKIFLQKLSFELLDSLDTSKTVVILGKTGTNGNVF